jgi:radical SAM superfamily enzyme YgiQ (UPF0313 family)
VASFLRDNGIDVVLIDGALQGGLAETISLIEKPDYLILLVGIASFQTDTKVIEAIKIRFPDSQIIVFGQGASFITENYLDFADYAVYGEPEKSILEIVNGHKNISAVSLIEKGKKVVNKQANYIENLDDLPFPARDLLDNSKYKHAFMHPYTTIYSSRGCPFSCKFCTSKGYSPAYRTRSVRNVLDELEEINLKYKIKSFGFMDDTFTLKESRTIDICRGIIERGLNFNWIAMGRVDKVTKEMLGWMKKAGCSVIMYGIESYDQEVLNSLNKNISIEKINKAIETTKQCNIKVHGFFIFGSPKDNRHKILKTIQWAKNTKFDYASFNIYVPYPGTRSFEELIASNRLKTKDWSKYDQCYSELVFEHTTLKSNDIQKLITKAYRDFYFNPSFILRRFFKDIVKPINLVRDAANAFKMVKNYL